MDDEIFEETIDDVGVKEAVELMEMQAQERAFSGKSAGPRRHKELAVDLEAAKMTQRLQYSRRLKEILMHYLGIFGFVIMVFVYSIMGGFLFEELEADNEIFQCKNGRTSYRQALVDTVTSINNIKADFTLTNAEKRGKYSEAADKLREAFVNSTWNGIDCDTMTSNWNPLSSAIWCLTVITTIGYGHIAPVTEWGRIVTIVYALFGIPITLVMLARLGSFFADVALFSYNVLCCCAICRKEKRVLDDNDKRHIVRYYFKEHYKDFYVAAFTTASQSPKDDPQRTAFYDIFGESGDSSVEEIDDEDLQMMAMDRMTHVPWLISVALILSTVFAGGSIFSGSEDWTIGDGIYFTFITVATIGFGDIYPSLKKPNSWNTQMRLLVWALVIILGLGMMSMCLNMIQADVGSQIGALIKACTKSSDHKKKKSLQNGDIDVDETSGSEDADDQQMVGDDLERLVRPPSVPLGKTRGGAETPPPLPMFLEINGQQLENCGEPLERPPSFPAENPWAALSEPSNPFAEEKSLNATEPVEPLSAREDGKTSRATILMRTPSDIGSFHDEEVMVPKGPTARKSTRTQRNMLQPTIDQQQLLEPDKENKKKPETVDDEEDDDGEDADDGSLQNQISDEEGDQNDETK